MFLSEFSFFSVSDVISLYFFLKLLFSTLFCDFIFSLHSGRILLAKISLLVVPLVIVPATSLTISKILLALSFEIRLSELFFLQLWDISENSINIFEINFTFVCQVASKLW